MNDVIIPYILCRKELHFVKKSKKSFVFVVIRAIVKLLYPKIEVVGRDSIPETNAILVGNHCLMNGPISAELYLPENCYIWCAGQMMNLKEVPKYAFEDFWSQKPVVLRPFYRLLSYIIAPFSVSIFNSARTVGVYHDMRILSTFKNSVRMLKEGKNMVIFPEKDEPDNNIVYKFQDKFVDIAKLYYKTSGNKITFVPMYISPKLKKIYIGDGIMFDPENDIGAERIRICDCLSRRITQLARSLPEHTVVPYKNLPKKCFLSNKDITEVPNEKTRSQLL